MIIKFIKQNKLRFLLERYGKGIIIILLVLCPLANYASAKPNEDKLRMSFQILDENFSLNNRTPSDLRRNQTLLPLAESAVSVTLEFYPDHTEFLLKTIRTLYVEGNYYLHTEKLATALQKLTLAKTLCEQDGHFQDREAVQVCETLAATSPILPALYSLVLHHLGLCHLGQISLNQKALLTSSSFAEKYLKKACELREIIDLSTGHWANVPDNNTVVGDAVIFKRNLGHFYFEIGDLEEAEKLYLDLVKIDDPFNQLLTQRQLLRVYQRKAHKISDQPTKRIFYQKATDAANLCLQLVADTIGNYTRVSTIYKDIGNLYSDSDNPFQDAEKSLSFLELAKEHCPNQLRITERYIKEGLSLTLKKLSEKELQEAEALRWAVTEEDSVDFLKLLQDHKLHILNYEMLGDLYLEKKSYVLAAAFFSNALCLSLQMPDTLPFQDRLHQALVRVERQFLQEHNLSSASETADNAKGKDLYKLNADTIKRYQTSLEALRKEAKDLLENNQSMEAINCLITQKYKDFITSLIQDTILVAAPLPTEDFAFVAFGSIGRGFASPYSDLEFAILLKDEKHKEYFKALSELFHIRINALGEAPIGLFGLPSLNWLAAEDGPSGWGLMLDSGNIVPHAPDFNLIGLPHHLASLFDPSYTGVDIRKKSSFYVSTLLFGKQDLVDQYRDEVNKILNVDNFRAQLVESLLQEDLESYYKNLGTEWLKKWGQTYNVKYDFYRPFMLLLDAAALQYGLQIVNPWQTVNDLYKAKIIDEETRSIFKKALDQIGYIRLDTCLKYKSQSYALYPKPELTASGESITYFIEHEKLKNLLNDLSICQKKIIKPDK